MGKNPAFQFYPKDWKSDLELQSCSIGARGLWIELMCIMHQSEVYGHLLVGGKPPPDSIVSQMVGVRLDLYRKYKHELLEKEVAKINRDGVIYCKRMVEDQRLREIRREAGLKGGNPKLLNQKVNQELNHNSYPACTPPPSPSPSPSPKKINEVQKDLFYKIEKYWSDVWKFIQRAINNEALFEDVVKTLEVFHEVHADIDEPWAWCTAVLEANGKKSKSLMSEEKWQKQKIEEAEDIKRWLGSFGKE